MTQRNKKFQLTSETVTTWNGKTLYRIKAVKTFGGIKKNDLGGFVETLANLAEEGNAWVYGNALVYGNAHVYSDARVLGNAHVYGNALVYGNAHVYGDARVYGNAWVYGNARVLGDAHVYSDARVYGNAHVYGNALVLGNAWVYGNARVLGDAHVYSDARVYGDAFSISPLQIQGSRHFVNVASHSKVRIGCYEQTVAEWQKRFRAIGKENNYTPSEIKEYKLYIDLAEQWFKIHKTVLTKANKEVAQGTK